MSCIIGASAVCTTLGRAYKLGSVVNYENALPFSTQIGICHILVVVNWLTPEPPILTKWLEQPWRVAPERPGTKP